MLKRFFLSPVVVTGADLFRAWWKQQSQSQANHNWNNFLFNISKCYCAKTLNSQINGMNSPCTILYIKSKEWIWFSSPSYTKLHFIWQFCHLLISSFPWYEFMYPLINELHRTCSCWVFTVPEIGRELVSSERDCISLEKCILLLDGVQKRIINSPAQDPQGVDSEQHALDFWVQPCPHLTGHEMDTCNTSNLISGAQ